MSKRFILIFVLISLLGLSCSSSTIEYFSNSIEYANQASELINKSSMVISQTDSERMADYYRQALNEAERVDISELNSKYPEWGDRYKFFISGLRLIIKGFENSDSSASLQGQVLLDNWGSWYRQHFEDIRKQL